MDRYIHGAGTFLRDVLLRFDLPQVAATVADRKLTLLSPVDAMKLPSSLSHAREVYRWTAEAYRNAGAGDRFRIERHASETDPASVYFA